MVCTSKCVRQVKMAQPIDTGTPTLSHLTLSTKQRHYLCKFCLWMTLEGHPPVKVSSATGLVDVCLRYLMSQHATRDVNQGSVGTYRELVEYLAPAEVSDLS